MAFNLLDTAKGLFSNELIGKASAYLGEGESAIAKAINSIIPTILGTFSEKAATTAGNNELVSLMNDQHRSSPNINLDPFFSNDGGALLNKGAIMASGLFGNKLDVLTDRISDHAGIKRSSASSLLSMATPATLDMLGKLDLGKYGGSIATLFEGQKNSILNAIPAGFNVNGLLHSKSNVASFDDTTYQREENVQGKSALNWLLPLLLLVLLAMAAWYFLGKGCKDEGSRSTADKGLTIGTTEVPVANSGKLDSLSGDWNYDEGVSVTITLPNGAGDITVGKYSTEAKLISFLIDKDMPLDTVKGNWFEFTNVHFKTGSAEITEESKKQLFNIATICKAFDKAQFKLGGYTDSTGSVATNIAVSQKRADAVMEFLKTAGVSTTSFTGTKGFGPEWPIASNETPEGRAQNRRVAVNVKAK